jgi:hypothetical protein
LLHLVLVKIDQVTGTEDRGRAEGSSLPAQGASAYTASHVVLSWFPDWTGHSAKPPAEHKDHPSREVGQGRGWSAALWLKLRLILLLMSHYRSVTEKSVYCNHRLSAQDNRGTH